MKNTTEIRQGRHCVFNLHVHLVFVTKYRRTVFTQAHLQEMNTIFSEICQDFEATLAEFNGERDHVYLLVHYPPKVSISKLVNSLKGVSSRHLRQRHSDIHRYYWNGVLWSPSYFAASSGGAPLNIIKQYIEQQQQPHV